MFRLIALGVAVLLLGATTPRNVASSIAPAKERCSFARLKACDNTNELVGNPDFERALIRFFGAHATDRINYLYAHGQLISQARDVLGGPPDDRHDLANGAYLFTACRAHSCTEKGAVAIGAQGDIIAVAMVSFHCGYAATICSDGPFLDIFIRNPQSSDDARTAIANWAIAATQDDMKVLRQPPLIGPHVHDLTRFDATWSDR